MHKIRPATESDWPFIWAIFQAVVETGDTFAYDTDVSKQEMYQYLFQPPTRMFIAEENGAILGSYMVRPNQPGRGSHVANAGFMVAPEHQGKGIGRAMGEHALHMAREEGYEAMQFNFVISTNARAVALWQSLGFVILGTIPRAFRHRELGMVDAYIMYRSLL